MSSHPLLVPSPYESYKLLWPGKTPLKDNNAKIAWELNFSHTSGLPPQSFKCTACMEFPVFFSDHYIKIPFWEWVEKHKELMFACWEMKEMGDSIKLIGATCTSVGKSGGKIYVCSFINCYLTCDILSFVWLYRTGILLLFNNKNQDQIYLQSSHFVLVITADGS